MSFQKIYGLHGLNHQIIEYSKKEKVITDKRTDRQTDTQNFLLQTRPLLQMQKGSSKNNAVVTVVIKCSAIWAKVAAGQAVRFDYHSNCITALNHHHHLLHKHIINTQIITPDPNGKGLDQQKAMKTCKTAVFCVKSNGTAPNASNQANPISVAKQIQTAAVQTNTNWRAKQIQKA